MTVTDETTLVMAPHSSTCFIHLLSRTRCSGHIWSDSYSIFISPSVTLSVSLSASQPDKRVMVIRRQHRLKFGLCYFVLLLPNVDPV